MQTVVKLKIQNNFLLSVGCVLTSLLRFFRATHNESFFYVAVRECNATERHQTETAAVVAPFFGSLQVVLSRYAHPFHDTPTREQPRQLPLRHHATIPNGSGLVVEQVLLVMYGMAHGS